MIKEMDVWTWVNGMNYPSLLYHIHAHSMAVLKTYMVEQQKEQFKRMSFHAEFKKGRDK